MRTFFTVLLIGIIANAIGQSDSKKEILLLGTMHAVPPIVKHSYKPLLKIAKKYRPEAVYMERIMPEDTLSQKVYSLSFMRLSDSLKTIFHPEEKRIAELRNKSLNSYSAEDYDYMAKWFAIHRDNANYRYYNYLLKYGLKGSKKSLRNEDEDLTYKLAGYLNMPAVFSMDDQQTNPQYYKAWNGCMKEGRTNGDNDLNKKLNKKNDNGNIIPAVLGRLGKHTNKPSTLKRFHLLNSFRYVQNPCDACSMATKYWDERNTRMATNIGEQVRRSTAVRSIVIVGAGHLIGLKEVLQARYPDMVVKLLYE